MNGEMNSPSGGKADYTNATLRPITIKQALDANQPYPEAPYQIDSAEVASVTFIGQVRNISSQSTNITYKLDDGTGEIEAKQWIDSMTADSMDTDDPTSNSTNKNQIELNGYARVFGKLKSFGNKRFVGAHCVRPIKDINELHCHLLEASAVHLFFTRGPSNPNSGEGAGGVKGGGDSAMGGVNGADDFAAAKGLPAMSPVAKRVYHLLKTEPQSNEGLHAQLIAAKLSLPMPDVARAGDELLTAGVIFSTVDEQTWAILEF
ncbi:replication protein A, subunit RPA32 [Aspergillus sclerotioniger CBS 115572]|uniref:Replication protein A, subunit RPA32 n=1 Tax=Aspergillus sclerotioniger CBS 115572 TaxID=1450535 RepID=A0A317XAU7_9EURO|nr:replication protein A, subunit RPA32 [Aspergillus sclerotioniger CBS 115572]PWY94687.1 replication protein A, subunit RPA32 [Aspergillus sclerotioniger CBS 115572]